MQNKLGFHYYNDHLHYQEKDLIALLPELEAHEAAWLVLKAPSAVAIPEVFIRALLDQGIMPILDFDLRIDEQIRPVDLQLLLETYSKWGVRYVNFFRPPNLRSSWEDEAWALGDVVERFLDRWVPFLRMAQQCHLVALFPALEPGGEYWDLSFLKRLLALAKTKRLKVFAEDLHMAVSAQSFGKPITWGAGASAAWMAPMPYSAIEAGQEDHRGFNTWQWYTEIVKAHTGAAPKLFLFWAGAANKRSAESGLAFDELDCLLRERAADGLAMPLPDNLLAIAYHKLVKAKPKHHMQPSLFAPLTEEQTQVLDLINEALAKSREETEDEAEIDPRDAMDEAQPEIDRADSSLIELETPAHEDLDDEIPAEAEPMAAQTSDTHPIDPQDLHLGEEYRVAPNLAAWVFSIDHYLLLPSYPWGLPENTFDQMLPIIRDEKPTIGFSVTEAASARKVTVWNENEAFSEADIQFLLDSGCIIHEQVIHRVGQLTD